MSKENQPFSLKKRFKSFEYAFQGLKTLFKEEHNARVHFVITLIVIIMGFTFHISITEWISILLIIGLVFACEILNSAIENICDLVSPQRNDYIRKAKDLGAAATVVSAIIAVVIGLLIFGAKIWELFF